MQVLVSILFDGMLESSRLDLVALKSHSISVCVLENETFVQACDSWLLVMYVLVGVPATRTATRATTVPHGTTACGRVPSEATGSSAADIGATAAAAVIAADYSRTRSVWEEAGRRGFSRFLLIIPELLQ